MPTDETKSAVGGGQPQATPEVAADVAERERRLDGDEAPGLAAGDDSTGSAIGRGGDRQSAGSGSSAERSGRLTSEGTGKDLPNPPDAGDPGGMGGPRRRRAIFDSPPGGVSPVVERREEDSE